MNRFYKKVFAFIMWMTIFGGMSLMGQNLLQNPGFETGELAPWFGDNNNIVTIVTEAHSGEYAAVGNAAQNVDLTAGVQYTVTCNAKIISATSEQRVWIGLRDSEGLVINAEIFESDWEEMTMTFTPDETGSHKFWIWGQGDSSYASDNWVLLAEGTTDVNDNAAENNIKIAGTADGIAINMLNVNSDANILIHDLSGKQIYSATTTDLDTIIDRSVLSVSGIYVVTVITDELHRVEKVAFMN
ncbi:MAG: T9SS C-terminal target domain-containing protein [Bacteroidetes bacterium]|nr:MAG: T9SS C-terminal target domain-containing protein [Bacteroidota bacterium]